MIENLREKVKKKRPLIHCITNPISINQCANAVLALGGRPMMAEHPAEVAEITETAGALLLNLGNISDVRLASMERSLHVAKKSDIPAVLDAVGVACSGLRREFAMKCMESGAITVIKGNYSEIHALYCADYRSSGVDAEVSLEVETAAQAAAALARKFCAVVLASGKIDIVTDGHQTFFVENGSPQLSTVTGTGCMLGAVCACCLTAGPALDAAVTSCELMGICGELAQTDRGSGSFLMNLLDELSTIKEETVNALGKMKTANAFSQGENADILSKKTEVKTDETA